MDAKFKPGDRARVRVDSSLGNWEAPQYIRGKVGLVEAIHGEFYPSIHGENRSSESLAHDDSLPKQFLYSVRFDQTQVWENYKGSPQDKIFVDIYEHWLEPV